MDRAQLLNDQEEAMRLILDGRQALTWTALPGVITKVDLAAMTCEVQPAIQAPVTDDEGNTEFVNLPLLLDVPIVFPSAGGFTITFPLAVGDEVLVVFSSRAIDSWWQSGGTSNKPVEARMHDLSDAFAIPGPKSTPEKISAISTTNLQIRNDAGNVYVEITAAGAIKFVSTSGKFVMKNTAKDLKGVLDGLGTLLTNLQTALTAFVATPVITPVNLAANGAALATALGTLQTAIGTFKTTDIAGLLDAS